MQGSSSKKLTTLMFKKILVILKFRLPIIIRFNTRILKAK